MIDLGSLQRRLEPRFTGLMVSQLTELGSKRVNATETNECTTFHRRRTTRMWQMFARTEAGKLCAVVAQT